MENSQFIRCRCPKCGQHYEIDAAVAAAPVKCAKCGTAFALAAARPPMPPPNMTRCGVCGQFIARFAPACPRCGALNYLPPPPPPPQKPLVTLTGVAQGVLLIIVLPIVGAIAIAAFVPPILWPLAFPLLVIIWIIAAASGLRVR